MILVDTNILIYMGNNDETIVRFVKEIEKENQLVISVITEIEMIIGCRNKLEFQKLDKFLKRFKLQLINESISELSKELIKKYYLSHGLQIADSFIAATSISCSIPLLTKNRKDFIFIDGIQLVDL